ncbi:hypothetical protein D3C80_1415080 [compost metagenome]
MFGVLEVFHAGQQHAGVGDDVAARLEHQGQVAITDALADGLDVVAGQWRLFVAIAHADAATQVQVAQEDAAVAEAVDQRQQAVEGIEEGFQGGQLRADMAIDADHFQVR